MKAHGSIKRTGTSGEPARYAGCFFRVDPGDSGEVLNTGGLRWEGYWVTIALKRLSESAYAERIVFKGGTSLSKAHKLIRRFSEDIDLAANVRASANLRLKRC